MKYSGEYIPWPTDMANNIKYVPLIDLLDIYRISHPTAAECTFFSFANGIFSRIDHMLSHKTSLNKFLKYEIISYIFSDNNEKTRN
jgi:hypothetical protein